MTLRNILLALSVLLVPAPLLAGTLQPVQVTFEYSYFNLWGQGGQESGIDGAGSLGSTSTGWSPAGGINGTEITEGQLGWESQPTTYDRDQGSCDCSWLYDSSGGSISETGSVFGLPEGSQLLQGSFTPVGQSYCDIDYYDYCEFSSPADIAWLNPAVLQALGITGTPQFSDALLSQSYNVNWGYSWSGLYELTFNVSSSQAPEPSSFALLSVAGVALLSYVLFTRKRYPFAG